MSEPHEDWLLQHIRSIAASTSPVSLDDAIARAATLADTSPPDADRPAFPAVHLSTTERPVPPTRNLLLMTAASVAVLALILVLSNPGDDEPASDELASTTTVLDDEPESVEALASAYWTALEDLDGDAAVALVDPSIVDSTLAEPFGRADDLPGQIEWYRAVGWRWELHGCSPAEGREAADCEVSAANPWSDALGLDAVPGQFRVVAADGSITGVTEFGSGFSPEWLRDVFRPFQAWVQEEHPEDAAVMWGSAEVDEEVLLLFELNTVRFVEAHQSS